MPGKGHRVRPSIGGNTPLNFASSNATDRESSPDNSVVQGQLASQSVNEASSILSLVEPSSKHVFIHTDEDDELEVTQPEAQRASSDVSAVQESDNRSASERQQVLVHVDDDELATPTKAETTTPLSQDEEEDLHIVIEERHRVDQTSLNGESRLNDSVQAGLKASAINDTRSQFQTMFEVVVSVAESHEEGYAREVGESVQRSVDVRSDHLEAPGLSVPETGVGWMDKIGAAGGKIMTALDTPPLSVVFGGIGLVAKVAALVDANDVKKAFTRAQKDATDEELKLANAYALTKANRKFYAAIKNLGTKLLAVGSAIAGLVSGGIGVLVAGGIEVADKVLGGLEKTYNGLNYLRKKVNGSLGKKRKESSATILEAARDGDPVALAELPALELPALMVLASDHSQHAGKSKSNTPAVTTALLKLGHLHLLEGSELHDALQDEAFYESVKKDLFKRMAST